jgi:hypothetical protein
MFLNKQTFLVKCKYHNTPVGVRIPHFYKGSTDISSLIAFD